MTPDTTKERLEYLRKEIEAERISTDEILELQSLAEHIEPGDVLLLQWAGVLEQTQLTLELQLIVNYETHGTSAEELKSRLEGLVSLAMGDGLLTGDTEAEVDDHIYRVFRRGKSHWDENEDYPVEDWQAEVNNNETRLGYHAWVAHEQDK